MIEVKLISVPRFIDPGDLGPREDQLQGTDAEKIIEVAGRECYDSFGRGRSSKDFHEHILEVEHESVEYHSVFVFRLRGISRGLSHELVRHHVGVGISQRSTRFVDESESPWVEHPALRAFLEDAAVPDEDKLWMKEAISTAEDAGRRAYRRIVNALEPYLAKRAGIDKLSARKQARGAARGYLGNALETSMVWSANVAALRSIIFRRGANASDAEIRELIVAILRVVNDQAPAYFDMIMTKPAADGLGETTDED